MRQQLLREWELGRRYTALGSFNKSADLKSLFTVNSVDFEVIPIDQEGEAVAVSTPELLTMWHRLNALACAPMQAIGEDSLAALAGLRRAAKVHSRYGKRTPASAVSTVMRKHRPSLVSLVDRVWSALTRKRGK
jgi:hypothetical protein